MPGGGFAQAGMDRQLTVVMPESCEAALPPQVRSALMEILAQDPRPAYQEDPERVYGVTFDGWNVRFCVDGGAVRVITAAKASETT